MPFPPCKPVGTPLLLTVNAGSSSIKFALYQMAPESKRVSEGTISGIGSDRGSFEVTCSAPTSSFNRRLSLSSQAVAVRELTDWLVEEVPPNEMNAIAYRIVQGSQCYATRDIDAALLDALQDGAVNDPEHMPQALHLIAALRISFPAARHIACFDTAFHAAMPRVARALPIPRRYESLGMRRHGFHGLACASVMNKLAELGEAVARGRVVIAHLGSGASVSAIADGKSIDSTMGLTPAGGIMMSSRSGDVDPGLAFQLFQAERLTPAQIQHMLNHESGLLGVSGTTGDLQQLLAKEANDAHAAESVAMFCYHASKAICAMAGALCGIDTLVFSGGVGEHLSPLRARICTSLGFIGVNLDSAANACHAALISATQSAVAVRIVHVDEQAVLAAEAYALIGFTAVGAPVSAL